MKGTSMRRWTVLGLVCLALGGGFFLGGCAVFSAIGKLLTGGGGTTDGPGIAAAVTAVNPLWGGILTVAGGILTAFGEAKKTEEGR